MTNLVLLPGLMCDERLFGPQIDALSMRYSVFVADLTGQCTISEMASDFLEKSPSKFTLAGLSMGGIVAMEAYRQSPERIERLALMDTNYLAEREEIRNLRNFQIAKVRRGELHAVMRDELKPNYVAVSSRKREILDTCMEMALSLGADVFERQSRALQSRPDQSGTIRKINVPTLILCGEEDKLCPVERHEEMKKMISGSKLIKIRNTGHLSTLESPEAVNEALVNLMETPTTLSSANQI